MSLLKHHPSTRPAAMLKAAIVLAALVCAACATVEAPSPKPPAGPLVPAAAPVAGPDARIIPTKDIDLTGQCRRAEEDGYREDATVKVSHNTVETLNWKLWVGRRGTCEFRLSQFRQVKQTPHIELAANDGSACRLMVWQDPRRITVASSHCEKRCTGGVYKKAWPVLFDPTSGDCAQVR